MKVSVNGVTLHVEEAGAGPPLLLLHGFTGSGATWRTFAPLLGAHRQLIAPDFLGHGQSDSPADPERYRMERCVEDLVALLGALGLKRADVLGYSMGGRVALHLAAHAPQRVGALVLESATPGLADPAERLARAQADTRLAANIERDGLVAFVDYWEALPLFASQAALPEEVRLAQRRQRLASNPVGLANSLRGMGAGRQEPLWHRLPSLRLPTLLLAGALDSKFADLARQMANLLPAAQLAIVRHAGHAPHLERPEVFAERVLLFLRSVQQEPC